MVAAQPNAWDAKRVEPNNVVRSFDHDKPRPRNPLSNPFLSQAMLAEDFQAAMEALGEAMLRGLLPLPAGCDPMGMLLLEVRIAADPGERFPREARVEASTNRSGQG